MMSEEFRETESTRMEIEYDIYCPHCNKLAKNLDFDKETWFDGEERTSDEFECPHCGILFPVQFDIETTTEWFPVGIRIGKYKAESG